MNPERRLEKIKVNVRHERSFTQDPGSGAGSGIVLEADNLTDEQMLRVARALGFPESAFLQKSKTVDYKLRFFSKKQEVNACVTATLAAASIVSKEQNLRRIVFETKIGNREVLRRESGLLMMKQPEVEFIDKQIDGKDIAKLLNIPQDKISSDAIVLASAGTPKVLIHVKTLEDLLSIKPDLENIAKYCASIGARGFYLYTFETKNPDSDFHARQFNPQDGIAEDPVTGVAAAALAAYLHKYGIITKNKMIGEQGYIIDKPGEIVIEIDEQDNLYVGGYVTDAGVGELAV